MILRTLAITPVAGIPLAAARQAPIIANMRVAQRRALIDVQFRDGPPHAFLIDTGGFHSLIDERLARELKLRSLGGIGMRGLGGLENMTLYRAPEVVFGGAVRQRDVTFGGLRDPRFGAGVQGTLAAGVFTVVDSDLDFDAGEWRLWPEGRPDRAGFVKLPAKITAPAAREGSPKIIAEGVLGGRTLRFLLDTGAPKAINLFGPAARASGLWDANMPQAVIRPFGIGGAAPLGRLVRAEAIAIGPLRFERPLVQLHQPGSRGGNGFDGIIGLDILQRMNLSTDTKARTLWAMPNRQPAYEERYGLSGMWVDAKGDSVVVRAVGARSPAAEAGIAEGDRIVGMPVAQVIRAISQDPDTVVPLTVERGGKRRTAEVRLRRFL